MVLVVFLLECNIHYMYIFESTDIFFAERVFFLTDFMRPKGRHPMRKPPDIACTKYDLYPLLRVQPHTMNPFKGFGVII